jgi:hypothetical protein
MFVLLRSCRPSASKKSPFSHLFSPPEGMILGKSPRFFPSHADNPSPSLRSRCFVLATKRSGKIHRRTSPATSFAAMGDRAEKLPTCSYVPSEAVNSTKSENIVWRPLANRNREATNTTYSVVLNGEVVKRDDACETPNGPCYNSKLTSLRCRIL